MATRDLKTNSRRIASRVEKLPDRVSRELIQNYNNALDEARAALTRAYERMPEDANAAQLAQFLRESRIDEEVLRIMEPTIEQNRSLLEEAAMVGVFASFFGNAWAVEQAAGVSMSWDMTDNAIRAAAGISDNGAALRGLMSEAEVKRHAKILDDAFRRYDKDTRRWITKEIQDGIRSGASVQKVAKRLRDVGVTKSYNSAMTIARTETLRANTVGPQIAYDQAADNGVKIRQVWDATLDMRTRPTHAELDGQVRENGVFQTAVGPVPGPRRSGDPGFDINCRCQIVSETEDFTPSVRRARDEGLIPYKTFEQWSTERGYSVNQYGQKYNFLQG